MVEYGLDDAVYSLLGVCLTVPALDNLRYGPAQDGRGYLAGRFVENIGEVIF